MRHALRRILWIVPTLFVISLGVFWLLSVSLEATRPAADQGEGHWRAHAPARFLNTRPTSVRDLSLAAMRSIAADDEHATEARAELVRLGGAALPHVLPQLDSLDPRGRARVALALAPVGKRMNVGTSEERGTPESAVLFWTRFWQDRAIEFRPAVVKRAVARLGEKSTAGRREDVRQLDTFALSELVSAMPPVNDAEDVKRVTRLAAAASRVTERPWHVPKDAGVTETRAVVRGWQSWWLEHRSDYVTFDGAERVLSMVSETQYGHWAADAAVNRLGVSATGEPVLDLLRAKAPTTLWLLFTGVAGGWLFGILAGLFGAARAHRTGDHLSAAIALGLSALPTTVGALAVAPAGSSRLAHAAAAWLLLLGAAGLVSRYQRSATRVALDQEYTRTARAFGASPWRLARWSFRASSVAALSLLGAHLPQLLTATFVLEHAFGLNGLASTTLRAVGARDVAWLMALSLCIAATLSLVQISSDALLAALDPRVRLGFLRKRGAAE